MRTALLAGIALSSAALLGLTPLRALAADPPSLDGGAVAPASQQHPSAAPDAAARKDAARQERPESDRPQRAMSHPPVERKLDARPLDLSAPPISHVMTPEQVQAAVGEPDDSGPEDVMVEESRYQAPVPRGQIQALTWALVHPLQAWRIFTPVTDE